MPIYDYQCQDCEFTEECFFLSDEKPVMRSCRACGTKNMKMIPIVTRLRVGHIDQGPLHSVAFGRRFKNEKDMKDYAKHHGYEPLENASVESVVKGFEESAKIKDDNRLKSLAEGIVWQTK